MSSISSRTLLNYLIKYDSHLLISYNRNINKWSELSKRLLHTSSVTSKNENSSENSSSLGSSPPPLSSTPSSSSIINISPAPFDTYLMMNKLQELGFSKTQSEGLMSILSQLVTEQTSSKIQTKDLEILELKINGHMEAIKHSQVLLEQSSIAQLQDSSKELQSEIAKLKDKIKDEVKKVSSGVQLDINLERSRNKEQETLTDQQIKDTRNKIDHEISQIKISMEGVKLDMLKYISGGIVTLVTILVSVVLGIWRLSK